MEEKPQSARVGGTAGGRGLPPRTAVGLLDNKPSRQHMLPVWFFVGVILLIYGVLILATGLYEFSNPPPTVLSNLHPAIWWGALLTIIGGVYTYLHSPRKP
jgi:hypothetical protein